MDHQIVVQEQLLEQKRFKELKQMDKHKLSVNLIKKILINKGKREDEFQNKLEALQEKEGI